MINIKRVPESALFFNLLSSTEDVSQTTASGDSEPLISSETAVLLTLLLQDGHARDLTRRIEERAYGRLFPQPYEIHWTLRRLERDGLVAADRVEAYHVETPGLHASPRTYRLTSAGRRIADRNRLALYGLLGLAEPAKASLAP